MRHPWRKDVLFVGEQGAGLDRPESSAGRRLAAMLGMSHEDMVRRYDFINLLSPGTWSAREARQAGYSLQRDLVEGTWLRVVLLGKRVGQAALFGAPTLSTLRHGFADVLFFPHPSGRNRLFNDPAFKRRASRVLRRFVNVGQ